MKKLSTQEKIITFLLNLERPNNDNIVRVNRNNIQPLQIKETDIMCYLHELEANHYIRFKAKSVHNDLSRFAEIELLPACLQYFEIKTARQKANKKENRKELRAWITLIISILALFLSSLSIYLQFYRPSTSVSVQEDVSSDTVATHQMSDEGVYQTTTN